MSNVPERILVAGASVTGGEVLQQLVAPSYSLTDHRHFTILHCAVVALLME